MPASLIDNHLSFLPAAAILAARDKDVPTPPGAPEALAAIAAAKASLAKRASEQANEQRRASETRFVAQAWGLSPRGARRSVLPWSAAMLALLGWWSTLQPSHNRVWADDVSRMVTGRLQGSIVTLDQVRNFDWRSDTDYTQRWEQRSYDLDQLRSVDVALSYWMGPAIAHTLVSFGFADGRYLTFSIEIRKERGESFDAIAGFFKRYETVLIAADEHDILRVRTNARGEDMYLYRLNIPQKIMRWRWPPDRRTPRSPRKDL